MSTKIIPVESERNYYCSNKFTYLKIDFEKKLTYNCHAATPHPVDFEWLEKNPGQLFNIPVNVAERKQMLANQRNTSCEQNCYPAEDRGQISTRILESTPDRRYTDVVTQPTEIDLTLFSECNLACSYCCKEYSSSWRNDLLTHGSYDLPLYEDKNRMTLLPIDILSGQISQKEKLGLPKIQKLLENFYMIKEHVKKLTITGGEPLLNNHLLDILENTKQIPKIILFTGLGVGISRFERLLNQIKNYKNVKLIVSAESTGKNYEFNRHGMTWNDFETKLAMIQTCDIEFEFHSTISNLTVMGFAEFYKRYHTTNKIYIDFVHHPDFMSAGNLDPATKLQVLDQLSEFDQDPTVQKVIHTVNSDYVNNNHRLTMSQWLGQFAKRRNLDVGIYPKTFLDWLNQ